MASRKSTTENTDSAHRIRLKLFGVGGAGGNAVSQIAGTMTGVGVVAVNTDLQALNGLGDVEKLQIGSAVTHGLGAGGDVELGLRAAQQDTERLEAAAQNTDLVFIVVGLGGGTGTGAAPVVARVAKEQGALVLAFAMLPFGFEGERRKQQALAGMEQLKAQADAVICIANDKLFKVAGDDATAADAFQRGNELVGTGVQAFWQLLSRKGLINVDFADLRNALGSKHSDGIFSFGSATGSDKSRAAVKAVMDNPLLDGGEILGKAETVLVSILGGPDMTLADVQRAVEPISRATPRGHVIMGAAIDDSHADRLTITVVATAHLVPRRAAVPVAVRQPVGRRLPETISPLRAGSPTPVPVTVPEKANGKKEAHPKQEHLPLEGVSRGRFDKSEPTLYDGEDLDVPTFIRRGVSVKNDRQMLGGDMPAAKSQFWSQIFSRQTIVRLWVLVTVLTIIIAVYPIGIRLLRIVMVSGCAGLWLGASCLWWRLTITRIVSAAILLLVLGIWLLPGRKIEAALLGDDYIRSLRSYDGTRYVWGGENSIGIDCSGLVRSGWIRANVLEGVRTGNAALIRNAVWVWWNDCTAKELGEGYREHISRVCDAPNLKQVDDTKVRRGDLAVTVGGAHVLAYLGDQIWIQADPGVGRVAAESTVSGQSGWFTFPVHIVRWRQLQ